MKVFLRTFNPYINSKSGEKLKSGQKRSGADKWYAFESILNDVLVEMGCEVVTQYESPLIEDQVQGADCRIYAHKTQRDIEVGDLFYMQMHLSELFTLDRTGWGVDHSRMQERPVFANVDASVANSYCEKLKKKFISTGLSKHPQPGLNQLGNTVRRLGLLISGRYPKDFILVPLQIPRDYVAKYHASITVIEFVHLLAAWAADARQNIVFKLHPYNVKDRDIIDAVKKYSKSINHIYCLEDNIHSLINESAGIFTINSGVGFEGLIHGKPVVTFGNCDYKWVTYRCDLDNLNKARDYIYNYSREEKNSADQFVYHYCNEHAYSIAGENIESTRTRIKEYMTGMLV